MNIDRLIPVLLEQRSITANSNGQRTSVRIKRPSGKMFMKVILKVEIMTEVQI